MRPGPLQIDQEASPQATSRDVSFHESNAGSHEPTLSQRDQRIPKPVR